MQNLPGKRRWLMLVYRCTQTMQQLRHGGTTQFLLLPKQEKYKERL
jgi:hypothetical protein